MRYNQSRTDAGALDPPYRGDAAGTLGSRNVLAANDNRPGRRVIVLKNFEVVPVVMDEIAVVDRLMQEWPLAANDNKPVS